ncbi:MAG: hypothetical protein ACKVOA_07430 [Methylophilaceae bacterium]
MNTNFKSASMNVLIAMTTFLASTAFADDVKVVPLKEMPEANAQATGELPLTEKAFVDAINKFDKAKIVEQLGEPASADDVRLKDTDKVVASIWHYHYINTDVDGTYYQTTELDFVDDKVVQVVFLNNDGSDAESGQKYDLQQGQPEAIPLPASPSNEPGDGVPLITY